VQKEDRWIRSAESKIQEKSKELIEEKAELEEKVESITQKKGRKIVNLTKKIEYLEAEKEESKRKLLDKDKAIESLENEKFVIESKLKESKRSFKNEIKSLSKKNIKAEARLETSEANAELLNNLLDQKAANDKKKMTFLEGLIPILSQHPTEIQNYLTVVVKILSQIDYSWTLTYEQLSFLLKSITKEEVKADKYLILSFSLNENDLLRLLRTLSYFTLPPINTLIVNDLPEDTKQIKNLLCSLKSKNVKHFGFKWNYKSIDVSPYVHSFGEIANNLNTKYFKLNNWKVESELLVKLMAQCKHLNGIELKEWAFKTDEEFSFGEALDGAKFKSLSFWYSGKKKLSDFSTHPQRLSNILKALGEVEDVRDNLEDIWFDEEDIKEDVIAQMLKGSNLQDVKVHFYS
jgi:hypothetical protein